MSFEMEDDPVEGVIKLCTMTQRMIDITGKQLDCLRTQCKTTEEITQKEIKEAETKLVKLLSRQLVAKSKLKQVNKYPLPDSLQQYPKTEQWLRIVGLGAEIIAGITQEGVSLDSLLEMAEPEIRRLMDLFQCQEEDIMKLTMALRNIKLWTDHQLRGKSGLTDIELNWTNYKSASNSPFSGNSPKLCHRQRPSTSSLPADTYLNSCSSPQSPASPPTPPLSVPSSPLPNPSPTERRRCTPPPTPPLVKPNTTKGKFPTTPPPHKRNKLFPEPFRPITKSKSHESQLAMRVTQDQDISKYLKKKPMNLTIAGSYEQICKRRRSTEGSEAGGSSRGPSGQTSPAMLSPKKSPPHNKQVDQVSLLDGFDPQAQKKNQLLHPHPPISPKTGFAAPSMPSMLHSISHRFTNTFKITTCDYCQKQMIFGYKCKECKFQNKFLFSLCDLCHTRVIVGKLCRDCKLKFHKDCASKAAPACGLPNEYVDLVIDLLKEGSPGIGRRVNHTHSLPGGADSPGMRPACSVPAFQVPDSSSNTSSCNSSTPSSPAFLTSSQLPPSPAPQPSPSIILNDDTQFQFPDVDSVDNMSNFTFDGASSGYHTDVVNTNTSNDSDKSDRTVVDSGCEHPPLLDRVDSQESTEDGQGNWTRANSISITLKEWDIPYEELHMFECIGHGRFGTVYKGNWHGDVAIKMLNMDPDSDNQAQLQAFKLEIAMLRKTRHENLVLFMGACMKPPKLAIITSLCKGQTLFWHVHVRREKFTLNRSVIIASQISQGMGYLHAKGIIHKDLKTKNIFLETGKVVITDFGLFNVTKLCHHTRRGEWLTIPPGWLCYLAPEIMQTLKTGNGQHANLPFTENSDVYAFGTVWYELLCGEWPFKQQPPEAIIWQVGKGMKQSLSGIQASRDVKDVLMLCWSYKMDERPDFGQLLKTLERLPKKRLARSPSHPIQLSRSAESVF